MRETIFISYRRVDSAHFVDRLYPRLVQAFGEDRVFKDVDSIPLGIDFGRRVIDVLAKSTVVLVVVGDQWLSGRDESGARRIDQEDDLVHIEVCAALAAADKYVIPLAIGSARFPSAAELPQALIFLASKNGLQIRSDPYFHRDVDLLVERIARGGLPQSAQTRPKVLSVPGSSCSDESASRLLARLVNSMQAWYNELVLIGGRIGTATCEDEIDAIVFSYVHERKYLPEVVAIRDILGSRTDMDELIADVNAFLDRLTIKIADVDHLSILCRREVISFWDFKPYNPLMELQDYLQKVVTLALRFTHGLGT